MFRVAVTVVMALALPLALAPSAVGKMAFDQITVSGPRLEGPVKLRPHPDDFLDAGAVAQHSAFWEQLVCRDCAGRLPSAPATLGPDYVLTYSMPSLRERRAAWLLGLTVREYRALEAGDPLMVSRVWERMVALYGWPV